MMTTPRFRVMRRIPLAAAAIAAISLAGCSSHDSTSAVDKPGVVTVGVSVSTPAPATTAPSLDTSPPSPATTKVPPPAASTTTAPAIPTSLAVIASHDAVVFSNAGYHTARVDILRLDRGSGDTVHLEFRVTAVDGEIGVWGNLGTPGHTDTVDAISLVDLANNLRYNVITDADGNCLCTVLKSSLDLPKGQSALLDATFPAPPASVTKVDVQLVAYGAVTDVPIGAGHG